MKNYFYLNELADRISSLLDDFLPADIANNIYIGGLSVLPAPERIAEYLPAVVISADGLSCSFANEVSDVLFSPYGFTIFYIYPYTFEGGNDAVRRASAGALAVADVLLNFRTLDGFSINKSASQAGGLVVSSAVTDIEFNCDLTKLFRLQEFYAHTAAIKFNVGFRTFAD